MGLPLEGVRVLDWTQWQQGPVAGMMLADLGADVIKIEERVGGDPARGSARIGGLVTFKTGRNAYFENNNRNKRGITLNLKTDRGKEILFKLIEKSDVFLHNFLPRVVDRLGLDYETVRKHNERLIYAVASGYGPKGPDYNTPSFDYTGQARSGIMTMVGEPDMPPLRIEGGVTDQMGAIMTAYGVVTALFVRERTGIGQRVDASLLGSMMWFQGMNVTFKLIGGIEQLRQSRRSMSNPLWNYYRCADDKWLVLAHLQPDRYWSNVCQALGITHLQNDPRFVEVNIRREHAAELIEVLDEVFRTKAREDWERIMKENDCICAALNNFDDLIQDPAALANDYIIDYDHPAWGPLKTIGFPVGFSETPMKMRRPAPEHGEHTEEILVDMLGYDWDEVVALRDHEIV